MIEKTVEGFYAKDSYQESYDSQHGPRLDALVERYDLKRVLAGKRVVDVGGGLGFLGKRLGLPKGDYWIIDGAQADLSQMVADAVPISADLDHTPFGGDWTFQFDAAFCLETLEHLGNPHHALVEIKKLVRENGDIFISIPTETVWHNAPYVGLLWPRQNWEQFLGQMALPFEFWHYVSKDRGWPAYHYRCRNAPWCESKLLFPKEDPKFRGVTPLAATNL